MFKHTTLKNLTYTVFTLALILTTFTFTKLPVYAVSFPSINVTFDATDESVIVDGIPAYNADGTIEYQLDGYLNYEKERCDTFCYAPHVRAYDEPSKMAYIFNWADAEFLLPCSGEYKFTAYVTARYRDANGQMTEESGPKTTITITLHKKDESTNWGPGLPNTTLETYDLEQIKGKNKTIFIEEPDYSWTIIGKDIESIPNANLSLKITPNPDTFPDTGVEEFFGNALALRINIEHNGAFGFLATLEYCVGADYTGKYANLFYVAGDDIFIYECGSLVNENGRATFVLSHASDYVIAITEEEYTGQELNPKPVDTPAPTETPTATPFAEVTEPNASPNDLSTEETPALDVTPTETSISDATATPQPTVEADATLSNNILLYIACGIVIIGTGAVIVFLIKKKK